MEVAQAEVRKINDEGRRKGGENGIKEGQKGREGDKASFSWSPAEYCQTMIISSAEWNIRSPRSRRKKEVFQIEKEDHSHKLAESYH